MRREPTVRHTGPESAGSAVNAVRTGRPAFRFLTRGRLGLLLIAAVGLAWLPLRDAPPADLPMRRSHASSAGALHRLAVSPDGMTFATSDARGLVILRPVVEDGGPERRIDVGGFTQALAFAPDGRHLVIGRNGPGVVLCDLDQEGRERLLNAPVRDVSDLAFAPDGRSLAIAGSSREILLWDVSAGRTRMTLRGHDRVAWRLAFAPDGRSLVSAGFMEPSVRVWDLDTGRPRQTLAAPRVYGLAYSPDGRTLATVTMRENSIRLWDAGSGVPVGTIADRAVPIHSLTFSPDGRLLATAASDGTASLWSLATGREVSRLDGRADLLARVAFSADGRTLVAIANDGDIRIWDLDGRGAGE